MQSFATRRISYLVAVCVAAVMCITHVASAQPLPTLSYVAADDTDGDFDWQNTGTAAPGRNWEFDFDQSPVTGINDGVTSITAAYQFPGAIAISESLVDWSHSPDENAVERPNPASFEMWFRPADLVGEHILWESGGSNNGSHLALDENELRFMTQTFTIPENQFSTTITLDPIAINRFNHVVATIDIDPVDDSGLLSLYLNGTLVDSEPIDAGFTNWDGGGHGGLGIVNASMGGSNFFDAPPVDYDGQIATFNFYTSVLSAGEVASLAGVPGIAGDFDADTDVDGADFLLWQRDTSVGSLTDWETNFGAGAGPAIAAAVAAVPEPASAMLALMSLGLFAAGRRCENRDI